MESGWVIVAIGPKAALRRLFLVALPDSEAAVSAVRARVGPNPTVLPQVKAESVHLEQRAMNPGDILELGKRS